MQHKTKGTTIKCRKTAKKQKKKRAHEFDTSKYCEFPFMFSLYIYLVETAERKKSAGNTSTFM